jgi:ADP-heptose:LPS heptosyltransferase
MKKRHSHKKKILLVNITRLGDMLQATPTIAGMKAENPDCHITVLVEKQFAEVCSVIPHIDEVVGIDLGFTCRSIAREQDGIIDAFEYVTEIVEDLRKQNFDYCLNMSSSAYTALLLNLIGITRNGGWTSDEEGYRVIESEWARLFATSVFHQNRHFNSLNLVDIFRCSADVEEHPRKLLINVEPKARDYCEALIRDAGFTNTGPLIALQAGASQGKRQWDPQKFVQLAKILVDEHNARVMLTGSVKESHILDPIVAGCASPNVVSFAGKTSVPQLAALVERAEILVTGDTGTMHMAVAVDTPVVAMFLASAFGFETGPYSEGNLVLQPVIGCGPCNPNKSCARPDCHENITPELMAHLTIQRLAGDVTSVSGELADPRSVIVYRSCFDERGFCDLTPINQPSSDLFTRYRSAYRKLWLDELGGYEASVEPKGSSALKIVEPHVQGIEKIVACAEKGQGLINELVRLVRDVSSPAMQLGVINKALSELDRDIEELGFHYGSLGPLSRMFVFAKENLQGSDALDLASQMNRVYQDLERRCRKFETYYIGS